MKTEQIKIAIIGGGAAGFFSAISAAEHHPEAEVSIYEATNKLLAKVLISGGGRCNVTNNTPLVSELIKNYPRGYKELRGPFSHFAVSETINWFESKGVKLKAEADGRMFPITDDSSSIANCLINEAKKRGVKIHLKSKVSKLIRKNNVFVLTINNQEDLQVFQDRIILTTGGTKSSLELASSLGHQITKLVPSLFSFEISDPRLADLAGVSFPDLQLTLIASNGKKFTQQGPVLITHWGLSGPATIKLSALAAKELYDSNYQALLKINFLPNYNLDSLTSELEKHKTDSPKSTLRGDTFLKIPKRYWLRIVEQNIAPQKQLWSELSKKEINALALELTAAKYQITGKGKFKDEFVTCGGVNLKEVDFSSMCSKVVPGLAFAGEVLDIDGITGGFNFQSAWTTGWIAGKSILKNHLTL